MIRRLPLLLLLPVSLLVLRAASSHGWPRWLSSLLLEQLLLQACRFLLRSYFY